MKQYSPIGIIGGMGPSAGVELARLIIEETIAKKDQDHLPVFLGSIPQIADRTAFLSGATKENPLKQIKPILSYFSSAGVKHIGIACNTCHAPLIISDFESELEEGIKFHSIIQSVVDDVRANTKAVKKVGLFSTIGCLRAGIYQEAFLKEGIDCVYLDETDHNELIHKSIYDPKWGIKASPYNISINVTERLTRATHLLKAKGAEGLILGCTELPLAFKDSLGLEVFNPLRSLARALIRAVAPEKLRDYNNFKSSSDSNEEVLVNFNRPLSNRAVSIAAPQE